MSWLLRSVPVSLMLRLNSAWATICEEIFDWTVLRPFLLRFGAGGGSSDVSRFKEMMREVCEAWSYSPRLMSETSKLFGCGSGQGPLGRWSLTFAQMRFTRFWLRVSDASAGAGVGVDAGGNSEEERDERVMQVLKCLRDKVFFLGEKRAGLPETASVALGVGAADDGSGARVVVMALPPNNNPTDPTFARVESDVVDPAVFAPYRSMLDGRILPAIARVANFMPSVRVATLRLTEEDLRRPNWWLCVDPRGLCSDEDMLRRLTSPHPPTMPHGVMTRAQYQARIAAAVAASSDAAAAADGGSHFIAYPYMAPPAARFMCVHWDVRRNRLFIRFMRLRD